MIWIVEYKLRNINGNLFNRQVNLVQKNEFVTKSRKFI